MSGKPGSKVKSGTTTVATAGTAVALTAVAEFATIGVWVSADSGNTGNATIGDSAVKAKTKEQKGVTVIKGGSPIWVEVDDPSLLFADVETSGDKVAWMAVIA